LSKVDAPELAADDLAADAADGRLSLRWSPIDPLVPWLCLDVARPLPDLGRVPLEALDRLMMKRAGQSGPD
jgi:hypothetical protein